MSTRGEVLVAILNNLLDFLAAHDQHWYRIPVVSAQRWLSQCWPPRWLAFYQTKVFGHEAHSINYYARVLDIHEVTRRQLFPDQPQDDKSRRRYYQLFLDPLQGLPQPSFTTHQIQEELANYCMPTIVKTINHLGGVNEGGLVPRKIGSGVPDGVYQLGLFDSL
jgi:hypothetical protein